MNLKNSSEIANGLKKILLEHSSLFFIAIGALSFFLANIYAKQIFSTGDFNTWIYTVSLISFFSIFAMMGQDQLLLRFSANKDDKIKIDQASVYIVITALIIFIPISLLLFKNNVMGLTVTQLILLPIMFSFCKLGYQLARAKKLFIQAQISLNGWKIILIFLITIPFFLGVVNMFLLSFFAGVFILLLLAPSMRIKEIEKFENVLKYSFGYLLSLGVMATFVYFERFLIEGKISVTEYADFLYFLTIALSIFTILASYFGFKEAVKYKDKFNLKILKSDLLRVIALILPISLVWSILIYFSASTLNLIIDINSLFLVCLIGIQKCIYSLLSSVMAVRMNYDEIIKININTILIFTLFFFVSIDFVTNTHYLLILLVILWFLRSIMIFQSIKRTEFS